MTRIQIKEEFAEMMLDLKPHIALFNTHSKVLVPYKETLLRNWNALYRKHFGESGALSENKRKDVFEKWLGLFFSALEMKNLAPHYTSMVEFGRELTDLGISLEEIIFSLHFLEEASIPVLMKHYPDRKVLTKMVFALDMLFHNELACLSLSYFSHYRSEIARLEKMKDDLTHMIVHDLKNPAQVVSIAADSLLEEAEKNGCVKNTQYIELISLSGRNIWQMVNNLLDINKMENGKFILHKTSGEIENLVDEIMEETGPRLQDRKLTISFRKTGVPAFRFDSDIIRRVISNLIDNAIKFSPQSGTITVSARFKNGRVYISVRDTGPGIKKEDRGKIFEKFGQAGLAAAGKIHGTGLGLTFCKMAVEASGGEISVTGGKTGSRFSFYLPAA